MAEGFILGNRTGESTSSYITKISVTTPPDKISYTDGDTLDTTGLIVSAVYSNGKVIPVKAADVTTEPANGEAIDYTIKEITVRYTDPDSGNTFSTTQEIKVERVLQSIKISRLPNATITYPSSEVDATGMKVTATYLSGDPQVISWGEDGLSVDPIRSQADLGTQTITVTYTEGGKSATDSYELTITTRPQAELEANSWDTISTVSKTNKASNYWSVGDTKKIKLSGTVGKLTLDTEVNLFILGFNHNSLTEGEGISFGCFKTASTTPIDIALVDSNYGQTIMTNDITFNMNHIADITGSNVGGWKGCNLRYDILGSTDKSDGSDASETAATVPVSNTLMSALPADLRAVMRPITKYTDNVAGSKLDNANNVTATVDYLPLLSEFEVFGMRTNANSVEANWQEQFTYYADGNSNDKFKFNNTGARAYWWLRSPSAFNSSSFCIAYPGNKSTSGSTYSSRSYGISVEIRV